MKGPTVLIQEAFAIYKANIKLFFLIFIVPGILTVTFGYFTAGIEERDMGLQSVVLFTVLFVLLMVVNIAMAIAMVKAVASPAEVTVQSAYQFAREHFWSYLWVSVLVAIIVLLGFVLLIVPGIIFSVWYVFSYFVLLFEGQRGMDALRRSKEHVRGKWWPVFGRVLFLLLISLILSGILGVLFGTTPEARESLVSLIAAQILNLVLVPVSIAYMYLLYQEVKMAPQAQAPVAEPAIEGNTHSQREQQ